MNDYGKIFKKQLNNRLELQLYSYNPDKEKYFDVIKKARTQEFKQVIINSEIMSAILYAVLTSDGVIMKINMSDNTDEDIIENINSIVNKLRSKPILFVKLQEELGLITESGSIDIMCIEIYKFKKYFKIYSNGIVFGDDLERIFLDFLKPVLEEYFNE
ncbi:hypothetical protein ACLNAQ_00995 [Bacillus sp. ICE1]|uniref:hypothetical protein n=1 Tax=Bacillus TaxID=1386 RepID=UPI001E2D2FE5|nr:MULTISPECIES: hypothetical protein [unclassified Bacillus (in: firmicutes)]MCC8303260.1 hypothetical protein [Bacillus sp. AF12]MDV9078851.1 hypothetical protein [Bacillus sp. ICE1]